MKNQYHLPVFILFIFFTTNLFAQDSEKEEKKSSFKFGVDYINTNVFMGRSDTSVTPVFAPSATYTFASGFFITAAADYIPSRMINKLDDGNIGIGYNYAFTESLGGTISFTKMFYAGSSTQIASSVSSELAGNIEYSNDYITPAIALDFAKGKKGNRNDIFLNPTVAHDFIITGLFGENDFLSVSPTAGLYAGTQNFYDSYLGKVNKKKHPALYKELAIYRQRLTKFRLLDFEFSAPVEYSFKPVMISFIPTYAIAENKLPKNITKGQTNQAGLFYFDIGLSVKF